MLLPTSKTIKVFELKTMNCLIFGKPKIGKTQFASTMGDDVLFLATEDGHKHVEVFKVDITKWEQLQELAKELYNDAKTGKPKFKMLVVDTVDILYRLCRKFVCDKYDVDHQTDLAYGKGSDLVKDEMFRVLNAFNKMGYGICFISHHQEREEKTKTSSWTITDTSLPSAISKLICGMSDFIFYIYIDENGERWALTKPTKYIVAGDRTGKLPEKLKLDFKEIQTLLNKPDNKGEANGKLPR